MLWRFLLMKPFSGKLFRNRSFFLSLRLGIGLLLLTFLIVSTGLEEIVDTFMRVRPIVGFSVGCCLIFLFFLGAFNLWLLLRILHSISFSTFLKVYSYSWVASLITPGQLGDASLILFFKKHGIPFRRTGIIYMLDKIITVVVFLGIAWFGSNILIPELRGVWFPLLALGVLFVFVVLILISFFPTCTQLAKKLRHRLDEILDELRTIKTKWYILVINILVTIVKWLVVSLCFFMAFLSFGVFVKWPDIAVIPIMSTLVGYIPVSIGGIGTVEVTAGYLFSRVGVEQSAVLSAYLFLRSLQYVLAIFMLAIFWRGKTSYKMNNIGTD